MPPASKRFQRWLAPVPGADRLVHLLVKGRAFLQRALAPPVATVNVDGMAGSTLLQAETVQAPLVLDGHDPRAAPAAFSFTYSRRDALVLAGTWLWPRHSVFADTRGRVVDATPVEFSSRFTEIVSNGSLARARHPTILHHDDPCTSIECGPPWDNYYHVMLDVLPRIWGLWVPGIRDLGRIDLLLCDTSRSPMLPLIEAMVPPSVRILPVPPGTLVRARQHVFLPMLSCSSNGFLPPGYISFFHRVTRERFGITGSEGPGKQRIYITRKQAGKRSIVNEDDLVAALEDLGFQPYTLERMAVADQARLFHDAEIVVSSHGAGLANIIHARHCKILEIFPGTPSFHYRGLALACGHEYACVAGASSDRNKNFHQDVATVLGRLRALRWA